MTNSLQVFRKIALAEGISFLVLLFIAMPMKYMFAIPLAVKIVGWTHGVLFMAYLYFEAKAAAGQKVNVVLPGDGIFHSRVREPRPNYISAPDEKVIENGNAFMVLGTDRPAGLTSGYGGKGAQHANSIDLVVGRMSSARDGAGAKNNQEVNNSFTADAARIHISQLTDVDLNFGLSDGRVGHLKSRSAIAIIADGIRIIGREGIKLVTGRANNSNEMSSMGGELLSCPPIDLMAGGSDSQRTSKGGVLHPQPEVINNLQPILLGENTVDALKNLGDIVDQIWSALFTLVSIQTTFNGAIGALPIPPLQAASIAATTATITAVTNSMYHTRANKTVWNVNYLEPVGYKYICSRNVNTT
jgi:integral membrane protein